MKTVRYIHWKHEEAAEGIKALKKSGYRVAYDPMVPEKYSGLKDELPDALVINLDRLPSHGREVALYFRSAKKSCHVPVVFVGGKPDKVAVTKQKVPGAVFTDWKGIPGAINKAIQNPPTSTIKPNTSPTGYSQTPLVKKLGINPSSTLAIINEPDDFAKKLGPLPDQVTVRKTARGNRDLTIWFLRSLKELEKKIDSMSDAVREKDALWIAWPKKTSGMKTDVTQNDVMRIGLAAGLVDYKVCAIDATWSGLKFARRKANQ